MAGRSRSESLDSTYDDDYDDEVEVGVLVPREVGVQKRVKSMQTLPRVSSTEGLLETQLLRRVASLKSMTRVESQERLMKRSESWSSEPVIRVESMSMMYLDGKMLIREVLELRTLRRGDHCLIALNIFQSMNKHLDAFIAWLGSWELLRYNSLT
jgi:hypothetical protein